MNLTSDFEVPMRGCLTTADRWVFVDFKRPHHSIRKTREIMIPRVDDKASIAEIAGKYFGILTEAFKSSTKAFARFILIEWNSVKDVVADNDEFKNSFEQLKISALDAVKKTEEACTAAKKSTNNAEAVAAVDLLAKSAKEWGTINEKWSVLKEEAENYNAENEL